MKTITRGIKNQQGVASLLTALVLLICITLVILLTSKTVLVETQITADNYRTSQATAAASAAMNHAEAYFMAGGLDQIDSATGDAGTDGVVDYTSDSPFSFNLTVGTQTTSAQFYFDNTPGNACDCVGGGCMSTTNMTQALVTARGWSDDNTAVRTITQCLGTFDLFNGGNGPKQPFVSKASVGVFGNAKIINRYTNSSIWTGGANDISGAAFATYLRPSGTETSDYTKDQLNSEDRTANTQEVSNNNGHGGQSAGAGIDIITDDATLSSKTSDEFFDMFFSKTKTQVMNVAASIDQKLAVGESPSGMSGLIWVDGGLSLRNADTVGSPTNPAILIVDGDLDMNGGLIYGVIYVTGKISIHGNPVVKGSIIGESDSASSGNGNLTLVYVPLSGDGESPPFIPGTGAILAGSWKDW